MCTYGARKRVLHAGSIQRPNIIWTLYLPDYYKVNCVIGRPTRGEPEGPQRGPAWRRRDSLASGGEVRTRRGLDLGRGKRGAGLVPNVGDPPPSIRTSRQNDTSPVRSAAFS